MRQNLVSRVPFWFIALIAAGWSIASHAFVVSTDEFSIIRNGSLFFDDNFGNNAPPPRGPNGPTTYNVSGNIPSTAESTGKLLLDSANGVVSANALELARISLRLRLLTNIDPLNLAAGLKSDDTLSLTGVFSATTPSGVLNPQYSIRFNDASGAGAHQLLQLQVRFSTAAGLPEIRYILQDFDDNTITTLGIAPFAPPAGADQIVLRISRPSTANDDFFGSFAYLTLGEPGPFTQFLLPGQVFQGENFVRAEFNISDGVVIAAVPEPGTLALLGLSLAGFAAFRRRKLN